MPPPSLPPVPPFTQLDLVTLASRPSQRWASFGCMMVMEGTARARSHSLARSPDCFSHSHSYVMRVACVASPIKILWPLHSAPLDSPRTKLSALTLRTATSFSVCASGQKGAFLTASLTKTSLLNTQTYWQAGLDGGAVCPSTPADLSSRSLASFERDCLPPARSMIARVPSSDGRTDPSPSHSW